MKIYTVLIFLMLISCKEYVEVNPENLSGQWKLYESMSSDGARQITHKNSADIKILFENSGKFSQIIIEKNYAGTYTIEEGKVTLSYFLNDSVALFDVELTKNSMTLQPLAEDGSFGCDEGCAEVYRRQD